MLINFDRTVAYRCPACDEIVFGDFSMFELSGSKGVRVQCSCEQSDLAIVPENKNNFIVAVPCGICDMPHKFSLPFQVLAKKDCAVFTCPSSSVGLVFVGRRDAVRKAAAENERYIEEVISACGLDHTGKNGMTMLKALDKIQELSDDESLYCECGSNMIDVEVRENDLILECCLCGARLQLTADTIRNGDFSRLEKLILKQKR